MNIRLKVKKTHPIRGNIAKFAPAFILNKPNFKNIKIDVRSFDISKYDNLPAWRINKQTQFKPNTYPIYGMEKFALSSFVSGKYDHSCRWPGKKTNPIQTQNKAKVANLSPRDNKFIPKGSSIYPRWIIDVPLCYYALLFLELLPRFLRHYSLDYLARWAVEYPCCMSRVNKPMKPCNKEELKCRLITPAQNPVVPSCLIAGTSWQVPAQWRWLRK